MLEWINRDFCNSSICVPTLDPSSPFFQKEDYWRGPVWINTNWLLMRAVREYYWNVEGMPKFYEKLRETIVNLVEKNGFSEYFRLADGAPLGSKNFSWTAALYIDTVWD